MKVILEYDPETGWVSDKHDVKLLAWNDLEHFGTPEDITATEESTVDKMIDLKKAGFTADDIIVFTERGLL